MLTVGPAGPVVFDVLIGTVFERGRTTNPSGRTRISAPLIEWVDTAANLLKDRIALLPGLLQPHIGVTAQAHIAAFAVRRSESQDPGARAALADI